MKSVSLVILAFITAGAFAQKQPSPLKVLYLQAKAIIHYKDGKKEDLGQDMNIVFFKDFVLFEQQVLHYKTQHSSIDFDNIKDGDTIVDDSHPDMTIEKITYLYYIYKKGAESGLYYNEETGKTKPFSVDTLFTQSNLGIENEEGIDRALEKPVETKRKGKKWTEKYYNLKDAEGLDTVFRAYDDDLRDLPFSISKKLDKEKNSKLTKSLHLVKIPQSLEIQGPKPFKIEILTEMELVTQKMSKAQLEKFNRYFEKYQQDILKKPITER